MLIELSGRLCSAWTSPEKRIVVANLHDLARNGGCQRTSLPHASSMPQRPVPDDDCLNMLQGKKCPIQPLTKTLRSCQKLPSCRMSFPWSSMRRWAFRNLNLCRVQHMPPIDTSNRYRTSPCLPPTQNLSQFLRTESICGVGISTSKHFQLQTETSNMTLWLRDRMCLAPAGAGHLTALRVVRQADTLRQTHLVGDAVMRPVH